MLPEGVKIFPFDRSEDSPTLNRDLEMAQNVIEHVLDENPDVTLILTGNLHSRLEIEHDDDRQIPMGYYLSRIEGTPFKSNRILSMLGRIQEGSFWASVGGKIGVHKSPKISDNYTQATTFLRYFLKEPQIQDGHNATLFLRSVSASLPLKDENIFRRDCRVSPHAFVLFMEQDFWTFDQSQVGHRLFDSEYCNILSAQLIDSYLLSNLENLSESYNRILHWHAGQNYAFEDIVDVALVRFRSSYNPDEPVDTDFHWNAYVAATIAFLQKDRAALAQARSEFGESPSSNDMINLRIIDRFIRCFDSNYSDAYSGKGSCANSHE
jgi:hypothetical protein